MQVFALILCIAGVAWLLRNATKLGPTNTAASWLVLIWVADGASRPIATWFSGGAEAADAASAYDSGNSFGRNIYIILLIGAIIALTRRRARFGELIRQNQALLLLTFFWAASAIWADYSGITLKRWIRDTGSIVMVLVMLTENDPVAAIRTLFVKCAYILIPFSFLLIRYFGSLGRTYSHWDGELMYVGVTEHKNSLGILTLVSLLFLTWDLVEAYAENPAGLKSWARRAEIGVWAMTIYLLHLSHSATSLVCAVVGMIVIVGLQIPLLRRNLPRLKTYLVTGLIGIAAVNGTFDIKGKFLQMLGKDPTLTTRTEIWPILLRFQDSPLLGPGFKSFWAGSRLETLWNRFGIIQAHNGYLETYLNGGIVGVLCLLTFLAAAFVRANAGLSNLTNFAIMRMTIWITVVVHNFTEASFNSVSPLWISLLALTTEYSVARDVSPTLSAPASSKQSFAAMVP